MLALKIWSNNNEKIKYSDLGKDTMPSTSAYVNTIRAMYYRSRINDGDLSETKKQ